MKQLFNTHHSLKWSGALTYKPETAGADVSDAGLKDDKYLSSRSISIATAARTTPSTPDTVISSGLLHVTCVEGIDLRATQGLFAKENPF